MSYAEQQAKRLAKVDSLFRYGHLSPVLQQHSKPFHDMATQIVEMLPPSAEVTLALRKLWEAKNNVVFAAVEWEEEQNQNV